MNTAPLERPDAGPLTHDEAMELQTTEIARLVEMLRSLPPEAWNAPTDCPGWDVRTMSVHVLGACEAGASLRENLHQMRRAIAHRRRNGGPLEAALSHVQVDDRSTLEPDEVLERLDDVAPRTIAGRRRTPRPARRIRMKVDGPVEETWTLGYLMDTIYLRDLWMHRIDIGRATDSRVELTPTHDGRIVADVVAEWGRRHGRPVHLRLDGPAGGTFELPGGSDMAVDDARPDRIELDAVEFCRVLAGREPATGLLDTVVPF